ncbi:MAG: BMP family ABC transporter substrate-binding protein [Chloroflexi bacterium]|nr:MAG: BMP family ABC transporter substrate-binding protein [Chloroflexota bacterium]
MSKKVASIVAALIVSSLVLTACGPAATETPAEKIKVAFIYIGQAGDLGWTYEHDRGRKILEEELGDQIEVITVPDVPDWEPATAEKAIRDVVQQGADVVFATSFGYMDPMYTVAQDHPDVIFEHCSGYKTADNMATYFGRIYQPRYLSGLVAGQMTENNFIGYVAAHPIPEVIRGINAFTLGVRKVNPDAKVHVVWTNTWYDPVKEREAAEALLDEGADIIAQHQDTTEPQKAAKERGMLSIGYDSDMAQFVGDTVLTSPVWNWGLYYVDTVKAVLDGTWETHEYWGGLADGVVELADLSPKVPDDVRTVVEAEREKIVSGEWDVFCGLINGQDGSERIAAGECMSDGDMLSMDWFVEGVVGTIPSQ